MNQTNNPITITQEEGITTEEQRNSFGFGNGRNKTATTLKIIGIVLALILLILFLSIKFLGGKKEEVKPEVSVVKNSADAPRSGTETDIQIWENTQRKAFAASVPVVSIDASSPESASVAASGVVDANSNQPRPLTAAELAKIQQNEIDERRKKSTLVAWSAQNSANNSGQERTTPPAKPLTPAMAMLQQIIDAQYKKQGVPSVNLNNATQARNLSGFPQNQPAETAKPPQNELAASLNPVITISEKASNKGKGQLTLSKGAMLDCVLITAISSAAPGMTSCVLSKDIYSDDGTVVLMERGSKLTGQYSGSLKQGSQRLFVLWDRVRTPKGIFVNLDSPGTDALGRSGLNGYVETHFFERFGAAMLFSVIDDVSNAAANRLIGPTSNSDNNNSNSNNAGQASREAAKQSIGKLLDSSINIPPTLEKNQGDHISVFLARDLDFSSVYQLRAGI